MDDSFSFGQQPKKRGTRVDTPPRHAAPRAPSIVPARSRPTHAKQGSFEQTRLILGAIGLVVVAVLIWGFMHFMSSSGKEAASQEGAAIGHAQDVQAQLTGQSAIQAAQGVYASSGSFAQVSPQTLKADEPTYTYTAGASSDPNTVSVKSTSDGVGLAVYSESGKCIYAHVAATGVKYGTGTVCTGEAALDASDPAWPSAG